MVQDSNSTCLLGKVNFCFNDWYCKMINDTGLSYTIWHSPTVYTVCELSCLCYKPKIILKRRWYELLLSTKAVYVRGVLEDWLYTWDQSVVVCAGTTKHSWVSGRCFYFSLYSSVCVYSPKHWMPSKATWVAFSAQYKITPAQSCKQLQSVAQWTRRWVQLLKCLTHLWFNKT